MSDTPPAVPIWRTVTFGYRNGISAVLRDRTLLRYFIYASALCVPFFLLHFYRGALGLSGFLPLGQMSDLVVSVLLSVGYTASLTPFAVAVHRKMLLDESPSRYYVAAATERSQWRYLVAAAAVNALFLSVPYAGRVTTSLIFGVNFSSASEVSLAFVANPLFGLVATLLPWALYGVAGLISARLTFVFPAIAIDASGTGLRQAVINGHGSTWRVFFVFLFIYGLPLAIGMITLVIGAVWFALSNPNLAQSPVAATAVIRSSPYFLFGHVTMFAVLIVLVPVTAAAASRAYEIRINRGMSGIAEVFA